MWLWDGFAAFSSFIIHPSSFAPERPADLSGMRDFHASAPVSPDVR
jgi:hypothetical protein